MNEKHVDTAQRAQAMEFMQKLMTAGGYTPILKSLHNIGVEFKTEPVGGVESIVIPVADLMAKEWRHMSEIETLQEKMQS